MFIKCIHVYELKLKLEEIRQGGDNATRYFNIPKRLRQDFDVFNDYEWKFMDDFNHHKKIVEDDRIYKVFALLNVEFAKVRVVVIFFHLEMYNLAK